MSSPQGTEALEHLLGSPFLEGFDPRDLAELARRATVVGFEESEPVFTQGNPATCLYLLVAGTVELSVEGIGRLDEARREFERAAALTRNERERAEFLTRAAACADSRPWVLTPLAVVELPSPIPARPARSGDRARR
jgi:hypothetical protein